MRPALLAASLLLLLAAPAAADQVAYVDGGQVWISTLDGAAKRSLSGPSPDDKPYQEVAQSDDGHVLGVRRIAGQQGQLNATRLWGPDGAVAGDGTLTMKPGYNVNAYPVTLDLTPNGKTVVYGYSLSRLNGAQYEFAFGTMGMVSSGQYTQGIDIPVENGTLAGTRVVGRADDQVLLQDTGGTFSPTFAPWLSSGGPDVFRTDVAASGTAVALELRDQVVDRQIALGPVASVGGTLDDPKSCFLDSVGTASHFTFSPDGTSMAWQDDRGVVVAGAPVWFASPAVTLCNPSRPAVVVSATGGAPSIGGSTAATPPAAPLPAGGGGGGAAGGGTPATTPGPATTPPGTPATTAGPAVSVAKVVKAKGLGGKGLPLTITVRKAGPVTAVAKLGKRVVATAKGRAKRAGKLKLRLKVVEAYRKTLRSLRGKTVVITVRAGGRTTTVRRTLR